ncbi:MAG: protein kinase [Myxococcota bacterium]
MAMGEMDAGARYRPSVGVTRRCDKCGRVYTDGEAFCPYDGAKLFDERPQRDSSEVMGGVGVDPLVGKVLDGQYRLERVLGQGGMGTVYAAQRVGDGLEIAVKVLRRVDDDGGTAFRRFEREARAASKLGEEHIVQVYDFATSSEGVAYLVMELLRGEDLGDRLAREAMLPLEVAMPIAIQCCQAVGAAHAVGIVHRDLKPENVYLVDKDGRSDFVKVVDFGLARVTDLEYGTEPGRKLTRTGAIFGTPEYMSPEQCMGRKADHRSDVYALGVLIFEMLAGRAPYEDSTFMGILNQHMTAPPPTVTSLNPAAGVPDEVDAVLVACLAKRPEERPQSMGELADRLLVALRMADHNDVADALTGVVKTGPPRVPRTDGRAVAGRPSSRAPARRPSAAAAAVPSIDPAGPTEPWQVDDVSAALKPPGVPSIAPPSDAGALLPASDPPDPASISGPLPGFDGRSPTVFSTPPPPRNDGSGAHSLPAQGEPTAPFGTQQGSGPSSSGALPTFRPPPGPAGPQSGVHPGSGAHPLPTSPVSGGFEAAAQSFGQEAFRETDPLASERPSVNTPLMEARPRRRSRKASQEVTTLRYLVGGLAFLLLGGVLGYLVFVFLG